jgi:cell wall-associated NlpC family hydrolase
MGRTRLLSLLVTLLAVALLAGPAAAYTPDPFAPPPPKPSWAAEEIRAVVAAGVMGPSEATFRPDDPITRGELADALVGLGKAPRLLTDPSRVVTMRELNAQVVEAAGLTPAARSIRRAVITAGLTPTGIVGSETVARLLGLRINHPQSQEQLELPPAAAATRAEAAYSFARLLALTPEQIEAVAVLARSFRLPGLDEWQRAVIQRALQFVGEPYVWAGSSEKRQLLYYGAAPGGFDCSGFVWRVYKLEPYAGAPLLTETLRGRTTFSMSAEVKRTQRIGPTLLAPADLVFFGDRGVDSAPTEMGHMGIYVGNDWFVHSSANGVTLQPMEGWYADRLAWGRRPLAEAGLVPPTA